MSFDPTHVLAILGMAGVTLAFRMGGYLVVQYFQVRGRVAAAMEAMPVAVLTAIVVPTALATGPAETLAAVVTLVAAWRLPLIVAVFIGTAAVVGFRLIL